TPAESYRYFKPVKGLPPTDFNPVILETLRAWLDDTAGRAKKGPEKCSDEGRPNGGPLAGFDGYAEKALADWKVPGMAVAIIKDGKVVLARGYGARTHGDKASVVERTIFGIASCTKSFTAACIALRV